MCFSAQASFIASSVLSVAGIAAVKKVRQKALLPIAFLPVFFSLQQLIEGLLWITLPVAGSFESSFLVYAFLLLAQFFWPFWVPFSFFNAEAKSSKKSFLAFLVVVGSIASLINLAELLSGLPFAQIKQNHIHYLIVEQPLVRKISPIIYLVSTLLPPFISSLKGSYLLGICLVLSFLLSYVIYNEFFVSVWCFFAALISLIIYFILVEEKTELAEVDFKSEAG